MRHLRNHSGRARQRRTPRLSVPRSARLLRAIDEVETDAAEALGRLNQPVSIMRADLHKLVG